MKKFLISFMWLLLFAGGAALTIYFLYTGGNYPNGSDTFAHIYKGQVLLENIREGNYWPLFDPDWYNGVQMLRFWAPLPVYVFAFCIFLGQNSIYNGFLIYVALVFILGAISWLYIGIKKDRPFMGGLIGLLWFFMPNNLFAMFSEGNLPRSLSMIFLPLFVYNFYEYLVNNEKEPAKNYKKLLGIIISFTLMVMCHSGYAGMTALSMLIFILFYRISGGKRGLALKGIFAIILGYILPGVWLVPSLIGGITSTDSSEVMRSFFQKLAVSINPMLRLKDPEAYFYIGLAAFILAVFGAIIAKKEQRIGFLTGLVIFICTTNSMYHILVHMPGSQYLWMLRFISIALCIILYSFLNWRTLKGFYQVLIVVLLILDTIPSLSYLHSDGSMTPQERMEEAAEVQLMDKARKITKQRVALIDGSQTGSKGEYLLTRYSGEGESVKQVFGAGYQSASTAKNIVLLNKAAEQGGYKYLFDRSLSMGADTVLVKIRFLQHGFTDVKALTDAAALIGFEKVDMNDEFILFHYPDIDDMKSFGTYAKFNGLAIGEDAADMCIADPDIKEASSYNLSEYSYEYLKQFRLIFLSEFTYDNKEAEEQKLIRLAENGTHILILGDGVPTDESTRTQKFLGVTVHPISFENGYPLLYINDRVFDLDLFPEGEEKWSTVYFTGLEDVNGYLYDDEMQIDFMGHAGHRNITFMGLNLTYHYAMTKDKDTLSIIKMAEGVELNALPRRVIRPIDIKYGRNTIEINTDYSDVNTGIAYQDNFYSDSKVKNDFHMLCVDKGRTVISMEYPHLKEGIALSFAALLLTVIFVMAEKIHNKEK